MTEILVDVVRIGVASLSGLLAALVVRLAYMRHRSGGFGAEGSAHPSTYLAFAASLLLLAAMRITHLGEMAATWDLYGHVVVVVLGWWGVGRNTVLMLRRSRSKH